MASFIDVVNISDGAVYNIMVGHPSMFRGFNIADSKLIVNGKRSDKPYVGVVSMNQDIQNCDFFGINISVYGNDIDGTVAAVKRLVNGRSRFLAPTGLCTGYTSYIDEYDSLGIQVADLIHNAESQTYYHQNNAGFAAIVEKILFNNNFELSIMPAKTLNTTSYGEETVLRVKHVNTDFSSEYKDTFGISSTPVVFSGGIYSNLLEWEFTSHPYVLPDTHDGLSKQMANEGWDVWEIELTGGPNTDDCGEPAGNCTNYTYQDLVDHYWPTSIAAITEYSGKNQIDYVGHSNGCRAALSSLNEYSNSGKNNAGYYFDYDAGNYTSADLPTHVVDKFVGVACPATLNDETFFTEAAREPRFIGGQPRGDYAIDKLNESGKTHVKKRDYGTKTNIFTGWIVLWGGKSISLNLMDFYNDISIETNTVSPGEDVNVSEIYLLFGTREYADFFEPNGLQDGIVHVNDTTRILDKTTIPIEESETYDSNHGALVDDNRVHDYIKEVLT